MAALPVFVAATVDLVPELSEEDKVVVPHIDLTQALDAELCSATSAQSAPQPQSPTSSRDGDYVQRWPVLPGYDLVTSVPNAPVRCVGGYSSELRGACLQEQSAGTRLRKSRWGRCEHCRRALRPGLNATGSPVLLCSKWKRYERHTFRILSMREVEALRFPRVMMLRLRVLW